MNFVPRKIAYVNILPRKKIYISILHIGRLFIQYKLFLLEEYSYKYSCYRMKSYEKENLYNILMLCQQMLTSVNLVR